MSKRQQIKPRQIKKASSILRHRIARPAVKIDNPEDREETNSGYRVRGVACKNFETFYECVLRHTETDKVEHAKKFRTYRVLGGEGLIFLYTKGDSKILKLEPGVEVEVPPATPFKLSASFSDLEVYVVQGYKYESRMTVLEEGTKPTERHRKARETFEEEVNMATTPPRQRSGKLSKARLQQAKQQEKAVKHKKKMKDYVPRKTSEGTSGSVHFDEANSVNPMPSMGKFPEETAG